MSFVLDASAALAWCFEDEKTGASGQLLGRMISGEQAYVPAHWPAEVLSAVLHGKRRGRVDGTGIEQFLSDLAGFHISVAQSLDLMDLQGLLEVAEKLTLSGYDAAYLLLARHLGLPLATCDKALQRACILAGIELIST